MALKKINFLRKNKAQVWIETAIYTLIGLVIIAILLAVITPQIDKSKDSNIIRQTIIAINALDNKISEIEQAAGNIRIIDFKISKGKLEIDSENNSIRYILEDSRLELSQIGEEIKDGNILIRTEKRGNRFNIFLTRYYDYINITVNGDEEIKTLHASGVPYRMQIENIGDNNPEQKVHINFDIF